MKSWEQNWEKYENIQYIYWTMWENIGICSCQPRDFWAFWISDQAWLQCHEVLSPYLIHILIIANMRVQSPVCGGPLKPGSGAQAMASLGLLIPKEIEAGSPSNGLEERSSFGHGSFRLQVIQVVCALATCRRSQHMSKQSQLITQLITAVSPTNWWPKICRSWCGESQRHPQPLPASSPCLWKGWRSSVKCAWARHSSSRCSWQARMMKIYEKWAFLGPAKLGKWQVNPLCLPWLYATQ